MAYIGGAMTLLARLRRQWPIIAPKPSDGEVERFLDEVFDMAWILGKCLEAPDEALLARRLSATRAHGYLPDIDTEDMAIVVADWTWAFCEVPFWASDYAIKQALQWNRRITIADVREALPISALRRAGGQLVKIVKSEIWKVETTSRAVGTTAARGSEAPYRGAPPRAGCRESWEPGGRGADLPA